jgi:hypothetical protein
VASTRSRPRGREQARPISGGPTAEHATKIYGIAIAAVVAIVAFLALTSTGHVIDAATQRFMLFYAGVFALIGLCASVSLGLIATDRMILQPGHRIFVQSAHRAASFGAVAFLIIHIVTEILAQRVHVLDAFVPFLSPFRTFYIGLGTIASDLVLLLVITGILRKRFTAHGAAWRWRAIHYTAYVAFVFGVWHGLLAGRPGKPYVDWSYGFVVALVALGLAVRILANSLRPKESLSAPPVPESANSGSAPMRAAAMFAQLGIVRAATSASVLEPSAPHAILGAPTDGWTASPMAVPTPAYAALPPPPGPYELDDDRQPFYEPVPGSPQGKQHRPAAAGERRGAAARELRSAAAGEHRSAAAREQRPATAGEDRPDAAGAGRAGARTWGGPKAGSGLRADAPSARQPRHRQGDRTNAAGERRPHATGERRPPPTGEQRPHAAGEQRSHATGQYRSHAAGSNRAHAPRPERADATGGLRADS